MLNPGHAPISRAIPCPKRRRARLGTTRFRQGGYIGFLAFTPDGKQLVSQGSDGVRVWDRATGQQIGYLPVGEGSISSAALTADGKGLVTVETHERGETFIRTCDRASGKLLHEFRVETKRQLCLSGDGRLAAALEEDEVTVVLYDVAAGGSLRPGRPMKGGSGSRFFSADGKALVTAGSDKSLRFWDVASGAKIGEITGAPERVGKLAVSPDRKLVAIVGLNVVPGKGGVTYFPWDNHVAAGTWPVARRSRH